MNNIARQINLFDVDLLNCSLIKDDASLTLFQKILLLTNGTVTDLLGLYTNERIKIKKLKQEILLSDENHSMFCVQGSPILLREVLIRSDHKDYIYAESILVFEQLSRTIQYQLLETDIPIGLLWKEEKTETYREVIGYKKERSERLALYFNTSPETIFLSRSYFIYYNKSILGVITEKFPVTYFS